MSLSEFDIIDKYFSNVGPKRADVLLGVGDDCAVLSPDKDSEIVVTVDNLVKDVHFDALTPVETLGYKAVMVSVSDIAAMGAQPSWLSLALTLSEPDQHWLQLFSDGLREACGITGVSLVGGNISRGPLNISTQLTGMLKRGEGIYRSGARQGDGIYVSGTIGEAGLGLLIHQQKLPSEYFDKETKAHLLSRLYKPVARASLGKALQPIATACIDISDGLAADLDHLLSASKVGASVELSKVPVHECLHTVFDKVGQWRNPICGGEDYELCFTAAVRHREQIEQISESLGVKITQIGVVQEQSDLRFTLDGKEYPIASNASSEGHSLSNGHRHF